MWFFDWFVTQFGNVQTYFDNMSASIGSVPYVGPSLASPFSWVASFFANLRTASSYASSWSDSVYSSASQVWSAVQNQIQSAYPVLTASASWFFDRVRSYISSTWSILSWSSSQFVSWIQGAAQSTWPMLTAGGSWIFGQIQNLISGTWWILTAGPSSVASWLWPYLQSLGAGASLGIDTIWSLITGGRIQSWISTWWSGMQASVLAYITGSWGYLITSAFTWINSNWASVESLFAWIATKMIEMMTRLAASFAQPLWGLIEAVLRNIDTGR